MSINASACAFVKPTSCFVRTNRPRQRCSALTTSLSSTTANGGHAVSSSPCVSRMYRSISSTRSSGTFESCATESLRCGSPAVRPTTAPFGNPCRSNAYAKYSWISRNPSSSSSSSVLSSSSRRPSPPFAASRKSRVAAFVRVAAAPQSTASTSSAPPRTPTAP